MVCAQIKQYLLNLGGQPILRDKFLTEKILDVYGLKISDPMKLVNLINGMLGVLTNGICLQNLAHILLLGTQNSIKEFQH
jgi:ribose 5-phosphate isomerase A